MDLFEVVKGSVPKPDKLKQLIIAHTGLSPPLFVAAVTAGAATIAAITCYFTSTSCAATDREINTKDGTNDGCCNCECKTTTEEKVNREANGDENILAHDEQAKAQELIAEIMAKDYLQDDADAMATPVETPKQF